MPTFSNKRPTFRSGALATLFAGAVAFAGLPAQPLTAAEVCDDVSGAYDVLVDLPGGGPTTIALDLEQSGCELTGTVGLRMRTPLQNGVVEDSTATFTFEAQNQGSGGTLEITWRITVDGDDVTGTFSHDLFGSLEVTGTRVTR